MQSREIHIMCRVPIAASAALGRVLTLASEYKLRIGKARSTSSDVYCDVFIAAGDFAIELISLSGADISSFSSAVDAVCSTEISIEVADVSAISVSLLIHK